VAQEPEPVAAAVLQEVSKDSGRAAAWSGKDRTLAWMAAVGKERRREPPPLVRVKRFGRILRKILLQTNRQKKQVF
jgi:hypothetical protein